MGLFERGHHHFTRLWAWCGCALLMAGCLACTSSVDLSYQSSDTSRRSGVGRVVSLGIVEDQRSKGPYELGVVRGGYGNVLKRLVSSETVRVLLSRAFNDALEGRGMRAMEDDESIRLDVEIEKLDCNYFWNAEAHASLNVTASDVRSGRRLWSQSYREDLVEGGSGAGVFADVERLRSMLERVMTDAVLAAVVDTELRLNAEAASVVPSGVVVGGPCGGRSGAAPSIGDDWESYRGCQDSKYRLTGRQGSEDGTVVSIFTGDGESAFVIHVRDGIVVKWSVKP